MSTAETPAPAAIPKRFAETARRNSEDPAKYYAHIRAQVDPAPEMDEVPGIRDTVATLWRHAVTEQRKSAA